MARLVLIVRVLCPNCRKTIIPFEGSETAAKRLVRERTRVALKCDSCKWRSARVLTAEQIEEAKRIAVLDAKIQLAPARTTDGSYKINQSASFAPNPTRRSRTSEQVVGAAKLYHYAVYVRHPWGTDRIVVGIKKRDIQKARDEAWDRVVRKRKTGDLKIMDAVPLKWTPGGLIEVKRRKTTKKGGSFKNTRRPRSRASAKQRKAPQYQPRNRGTK